MRFIKNKYNCVLLCLTIAVTIIFIAKCFISGRPVVGDEMYSIAEGLRFFKGDAMLVDDWNLGQMTGFLLIPFIALFKLFSGGTTEGILLFMRFMYLAFKLIISGYCLYRLDKYRGGVKRRYSVIGIAFYYFFTPFNIDGLTYNTIAIAMILVMGILLLTNRNKKSDFYLFGVCLAIAILAHPYLMLIYVLGTLILVLYAVINAGKKDKTLINTYISQWLFITFGAAAVAVIFCIYIFSNASLSDITINLRYMLSDPEHNEPFVDKLVSVIVEFFKRSKIYLNIFCIAAIFIFSKRKTMLTVLSAAVLTLSCIDIFKASSSYVENFFYIPFVWFGIEELIIYKNKRHMVIYAFCLLSVAGISLGTNTGIISASAAMCPIASFSVIFLGDNREWIENQQRGKRFKEPAVMCMFGMMLLCVLFMRTFKVWIHYMDRGNVEYFVERGPLKGTFTYDYIYYKTRAIMDDFDKIEYSDDDVLFVGSGGSFPYVYADMNIGTLSVSFFDLDYDRIETYFELHPDKEPDVIYYDGFAEEDLKTEFYQKVLLDYDVEIKDGDRLIALKK